MTMWIPDWLRKLMTSCFHDHQKSPCRNHRHLILTCRRVWSPWQRITMTKTNTWPVIWNLRSNCFKNVIGFNPVNKLARSHLLKCTVLLKWQGCCICTYNHLHAVLGHIHSSWRVEEFIEALFTRTEIQPDMQNGLHGGKWGCSHLVISSCVNSTIWIHSTHLLSGQISGWILLRVNQAWWCTIFLW